jgi:hypothetical protein
MIKRIAVGTLMASSAFAQSEAAAVDKLKAELQSKMTVLSYNMTQESTVAGAPFSSDETTTTTQTLFDGNRIVNSSTIKVYRDQQGRTRVERTLSNIGSVAAEQSRVNVTINDPVAAVRYVLDAGSKTAFKTTLGGGGNEGEIALRARKLAEEKEKMTAAQAQGDKQKVRTESGSFTVTSSNGAFTTSSGPVSFKTNAKREDLGASNMAGVPVQGSRSTTVIPAGTMGNDRDINIVEERWYSPELKMNIMTKRTDPRMGETVFQVNNLTRSNPDPSLFQVPADYQVKEGGGRGNEVVRILNKE